MSRRRVARTLTWIPIIASVLSLALFLVVRLTGCSDEAPVFFLAPFATGIGFAFLSFLIVRFQPANRIGWLAAFIGLIFPVLNLSTSYLELGCIGQDPSALPAAAIAAWISYMSPFPAVVALFIALPILFPDGRFVTLAWRRFGQIAFILLSLLAFLVATLPGPLQYNPMGSHYPYQNPFALPLLPESAGPILGTLLVTVTILVALGANLSLVRRWRLSVGEARQPLKWFAYFLATAVTSQLIIELYGALVDERIFDSWLYSLVLVVVFSGFPLTVGVAVLKYRLYDIDVIIRRTVIYGALTAVLAAVYFSSVILLQAVFRSVSGQESPLVIVLSTLLIAALFSPLRGRMQGILNRRFFRQKYDADQVLAHFAQHARDEVELEALTAELLAAIDETMRPESAGVWLKGSDGRAAGRQSTPNTSGR